MREPTAGMCVTPNVRLERKFGGGGMGAVWRAEHLALKVPVVVKFLSPSLLTETDALGRFAREASAAAAVRSPHVVQMLDHGVHEGLPFIVMELLDGEDLSHLLAREGRLPAARVVAIIAQVSKALMRAHERGIIHRDVKPANLFLCEVGHDETFVKVLDFGIAKRTGELTAESVTGSVMGTLFYMSPEQIRDSKNIDHRTDVWALGVVAYEMLTGVRPFGGDNVAALSLRIVADPLPVPSQQYGALPRELDAWFAKACARLPAERFQSVRALSDALASALESAPALAATMRAAGAGGIVTKPGHGESSTMRIPGTRDPVTVAPEARRHDAALAETLASQPQERSPAATAIPTSTVDGVGVGESFVARPASPKRSAVPTWAMLSLVAVALVGGGIYALTRQPAAQPDGAPTSGGRVEPPSASPGLASSTTLAAQPSAPASTAASSSPSTSASVASGSVAAAVKPPNGTVKVPTAKSAPVVSVPPSSTWKDIE